ncbi:MAG TPA: DUF5103 domain-containing protein [Flavobacteriales bacterium]|nr:DUF5103 domain-containing protein [Flavobacteriales bacterium]
MTSLLLSICIFSSCVPASTVTNTSATETKKHTPEFYNEKEVLMTDKVYKDNIKSVICHSSMSEISAPIIAMNTDEFVTIRFDDLDNSVKTYNYSIIHCNADWTASDLMEIEYLDGFFQGNITHYDYSFNTLLPYINYKFDFPTSNTKVLIPGNYIVFVYENNDKADPVLTRRIMIFDQRANVSYTYKRSDDPEERNYKQEIDFSVFTNNLTLNDGFRDLNVVILQNYRWDNAITKLEPKYIQGTELVYNLEEPQTFQGLNEFRHVNLGSTTIKGSRMFSIGHDSTLYNCMLLRDEKRSYKKYITYGDINGRFKVNRDGTDDEHTRADYMWVTFSVDQNTEVKEGDIYLFGLFTDWEVKPEFKLNFNAEMGVYMTTIKLKQGNYDYMYVMSPKNKNSVDNTFIEGSHFDTENQYTILVYYHDIKRNTDLLVGVSDFNNANRR